MTDNSNQQDPLPQNNIDEVKQVILWIRAPRGMGRNSSQNFHLSSDGILLKNFLFHRTGWFCKFFVPSYSIPWNHILVKYRFKKQILRTTIVLTKPLRCSIIWPYSSGGSSSAANSDQRKHTFCFRFRLRKQLFCELRLKLRKIFSLDPDSNSDSEEFCLRDSDAVH